MSEQVHPSAATLEEEEEEEEGEEEVLREAGVALSLQGLHPSPEQQAPVELLAEFLRCVMAEEYAAAKILCQKLIELEPGNQTAHEFLPVIMERLRLDEELETESSSEEEEENDDEEEETSSEEEEKEAVDQKKHHCSHSKIWS